MFPQLPQGLCAIPLRRYVYVLRERPFAFRHWERGGPQGTPPRDLILCLSRHLAQRLLTSAQDTLIDVVRPVERKVPVGIVCFDFGLFLFCHRMTRSMLVQSIYKSLISNGRFPPFMQILSYCLLELCTRRFSARIFFEMLVEVWKFPFRLSATNSLIRTYWTHPRHWKCLSLRHWIVPILVRVSQPSDDYSGSPIKSHQYVWQNMCPSEHHWRLILHSYEMWYDFFWIWMRWRSLEAFIAWYDHFSTCKGYRYPSTPVNHNHQSCSRPC